MARAELNVDVNIKKGKDLKVVEALHQKCDEFKRRIDQLCASKIHEELRRIGIKYNANTDTWQFLDVGQEKSLGALLYKLFEYHRVRPVGYIILEYHREQGTYNEFVEWLHEHGVHIDDVSEEVGFECTKTKVHMHPVTDQKEISEDDVG